MSSKLKMPLIVLGVVVFLAVAAFVGLSLLSPNLAGLPLFGAVTGGSAKQSGVKFNLIPATEVPTTNPDVTGDLQARQDNSLTVQPLSNGAPAPVVEVVVTTQTRLYRDATMDQYATPPALGTSIQMVVEPYHLDQISAGDRLIAWGERRGDRLVADVVLIRTRLRDNLTTPAAP